MEWSTTDGWDLETGNPSLVLFSNAVQVWSTMQDRPTTIQEAAKVFRVTEAEMREAVESHYWMFIGSGDVIEHEGE